VRLLMVAPPGAGKGTQAQRLAAHYGIAKLSSGDLFRTEVTAGTEIGRQVATTCDAATWFPTRWCCS
jgi:adenylate kinase